jgi:hypothetical protein
LFGQDKQHWASVLNIIFISLPSSGSGQTVGQFPTIAKPCSLPAIFHDITPTFITHKKKKMELNKKPWPLSTIFGIRERIDTNPDYQRPPVWSLSQKRLLIDTILRGYDIPKMYWRKISKNPDKYEVVDGQQRLRAIWEFMNGEFDLGKTADQLNGVVLKNLKYKDNDPNKIIPDELRLSLDTYTLDIIVLTDTDDEEVREMFLRLQNGTTLKSQEKRNAMAGKMRDFIKNLSTHKFFDSCNYDNSRFTFDLIAAQMTKLEMEGGSCNIKNGDLNKMYSDYENFDATSLKAKKIKRVLDFLLLCFPSKTPELERYSSVSLYLLVSFLMERYAYKGYETKIFDWFISFETYRREQRKLDVEKCDPKVLEYHEKTSHSTDSSDSIQLRHEYLLGKFLDANPEIELKDNNRIFTHEQRLAIFRRDKGHCQVKIKCGGDKCEWDNWEADHIKAWDSAGNTTVENGQVACIPCNKTKSNN